MTPISPDFQTPAAARAGIAAALAKHYAELSGTDSQAPPFSIARHLLALAERRPITGREREVCEGAALVAGQRFDPCRAWLPFGALDTRSLTTTPGSAGGYLSGVTHASPVDVLRPWSVIASAGVMMMPNLTDGVVIPRATASSAVTWIGEVPVAPAESPPTLGDVSLTPKTAIALVHFSLQLLRQGAAAEAFIRAHLLRAAGRALDEALLGGAGGAQPLGLVNTPGPHEQAGASLDLADLLDMRAAILDAGGNEDSLRWIAPPAVQKLLGGRPRASGGEVMLWDSGAVLGRPAHATATAPAATLLAGDFSLAVVGVFGPGLRIDVDPAQDFNRAGLVARVLMVCDVAFPQPAAFAVATAVT